MDSYDPWTAGILCYAIFTSISAYAIRRRFEGFIRWDVEQRQPGAGFGRNRHYGAYEGAAIKVVGRGPFNQ